MPRRALRPCAAPTCGALVERGYCARHAHRAAPLERWRGSSRARGYDQEWRLFRRAFLDEPENQTCADCGAPSRDVHHLQKVADHPELRLVKSNCRALCQACHSRRTARGE